MKNEFGKSGQEGYNQSDKNKKNLDPQAKQGQKPGQKSVLTGTSGEDKKQPQKQGFGQSAGQQKQQSGFAQYGPLGTEKSQQDIKSENQSSVRSEAIGYQPGVNTPGREQQQDPQAKQQAPGRDKEVPARPEKEGGDLEHLRNPDKTTAPERKEIDPVASSKRESQPDLRNNPSGKDQQNPIV